MKFARAISNGVGLHCPDLTAGAPVYTPDELGVEDPDADVAPLAQGGGEGEEPPPTEDMHGAESAGGARRMGDLADAARRCGYEPATVAELCRFYYDQPRPAELEKAHAAEMADRLRLARVQGVSDARLRALAAKGLGMGDIERARQAADLWLTFRGRDGAGESSPA